MTAGRLAVAAITIDFGNTLVRVDSAGLRGVVEQTSEELTRRGIVRDRPAFLAAWAEERERQFREEVPEFCEVDIAQRAVRVIARLRGMPPPPEGERWDDTVAAGHVAPAEIEQVVDAYSGAFIGRMSPVADAADTLRQLASRGFALAILSNWPLALTVDRFAEAQGWLPYLRSIVVSQRVGIIKPHPSIFRAAEAALGMNGSAESSPDGSAGGAAGRRILHVGDDWAADVVGASRAGWRTAYLRNRQLDTPLPKSEPGDDSVTDSTVVPDLVIDELADLDARVEPLAAI